MRDPVHNLIEFDGSQFEQTMWRVIQTSPFQRLRRIKQLGFSDFVFPGATHTRFAHSIGVFHTARALMRTIKRQIDSDQSRRFGEYQASVALAAALVHDVGHGMFSHAFERVGATLDLPMANHERVSELLISDGPIADELTRELGSGFAHDVATLIGRKEPGNLYDAVVSSQFDADRLDYIQRDRMMAGVQSSAIDLVWLMANLELATVPTGADGEVTGAIETLILGPKAVQAAEGYVLSLFHLYPNLYLHKTTRGAEALFRELMLRLFYLVREGHADKTGLTSEHPIMRFAREPELLDNALRMDDLVFSGALPMMAEARDRVLARLAGDLMRRELPTCVDIRRLVEKEMMPVEGEPRATRQARISLACTNIKKEVEAAGRGRIVVDKYSRAPYKRYQDSDTPLNRILVRGSDGQPRDMADFSPVVAAAEDFEICRAYVLRDDQKSVHLVENIIRTEVRGSG